MAKEFSIKITPEGDIYFIMDDDSPLRDLGHLQMKRASNVEWDEDAQAWKVIVNMGINQVDLDARFDDRKEAIAFEVEMLTQFLEGNAIDIPALFK